ncbi:hypothetical protein [Paraburkholderia sp. RL17-381-BIF-C]|uniref:hypothetical protein n=1 Tax=Paraburkholderia sp. RL17-381-BIF-C TaxID=3031635 RepID=UPI0038BCFD94
MNKNQISIFPSIVITAIALTGCAIHLVSDYDADTDKGVSDIKTELTQIFSKMRDCARQDTRAHTGTGPLPKDPARIICDNPASTYSAGDYNKIQGQLDTLIVRSESIAHNQITTNSLINLEAAILQYPVQSTSPSGDTSNANSNKPIMSIEERQQLPEPISLADLNNLSQTSDSLIRSILVVELAKKSGETPSGK